MTETGSTITRNRRSLLHTGDNSSPENTQPEEDAIPQPSLSTSRTSVLSNQQETVLPKPQDTSSQARKSARVPKPNKRDGMVYYQVFIFKKMLILVLNTVLVFKNIYIYICLGVYQYT